ncbi:hypothetical protein GCM10012286_57900 [Streptomyces lasiicapitis]|uniref:Uncharacterized protein n=1 Tax=Streptomyces lasiicapitis TaxID=1923961 RepID=A0ABQ2MIJ5_9ACTN|nr:hypothetical protein GCM10012286_57900 [Streptomyces lasiicapitis]
MPRSRAGGWDTPPAQRRGRKAHSGTGTQRHKGTGAQRHRRTPAQPHGCSRTRAQAPRDTHVHPRPKAPFNRRPRQVTARHNGITIADLTPLTILPPLTARA